MSPVAAPADRRFRRSHTKPSKRKSRWRSLAKRAIAYGSTIAIGVCGAYFATDAVAHAGFLEIDEIAVQGNERMPTGEVIAVLDGMRGENILRADLDGWRTQLLASPWILEASLRRTLPSTIEVTVSERSPMAIARLNRSLYLVDASGTVIDIYGPQYADLDLPIVDGLAAGLERNGSETALTTDEERAALAARVIASLAPRPDLARRLSQIDVSDRHNVSVILAGDPAVISVGTDRFLLRLQSYAELAATLRQRVPDIDHVDLRFDDRIYVRPANAPRSRRPLALSSGGQPVQMRSASRR